MNPADNLINLKTGVLTTGSCFSEAIGNRLFSFKVQTLVNPFGTTYNPASIHNGLNLAARNAPISEHHFVQSEDIHLNYDFHSSLSEMSHAALKVRLQKQVQHTHDFLKKTSVLMITYGTAWVYHLNQTGEIVANCHKQNASLFSKSLLSQKHILESFTTTYRQLKALNPEIRIILTVSPVRHIKDTLELNSVGKSVLRLSCHTVAEQFPDVEYFPAFEMMVDDLRDYRFYKSDLIHPSAEAEDYIWENFLTRYADPSFKTFITKWKAVQSALAHRPFHPQSNGHQHFISETLKKLHELSSLVDVSEERASLESQLK
jgi:hypothetical protein